MAPSSPLNPQQAEPLNCMTPSASADEREAALFRAAVRLPTLKEATDLLVQEALRRAGGNQTTAARLLGISQQAMSKRLKKRQS